MIAERVTSTCYTLPVMTVSDLSLNFWSMDCWGEQLHGSTHNALWQLAQNGPHAITIRRAWLPNAFGLSQGTKRAITTNTREGHGGEGTTTFLFSFFITNSRSNYNMIVAPRACKEGNSRNASSNSYAWVPLPSSFGITDHIAKLEEMTEKMQRIFVCEDRKKKRGSKQKGGRDKKEEGRRKMYRAV